MNNDGFLDIAVANWGQVNRYYLSNGNSVSLAYTGADISSSDTQYSTSIALGDLNNDGFLDIAIANSGAQRNKYYLSNGNSVSLAYTGADISSDTQSSLSIALGDLNNDGFLDIAVANSSGQVNKYYLSNGAVGGYAAGVNISGDTDTSASIALGDLNNDGFLDIAVANSGQVNKYYLSNRNAFALEYAGYDISADSQSSKSIALGDLNNDGFLDIAVANYNQVNKYYLSNRNASALAYTGAEISSSDTQNSYSIALGDLNNDGFLDIAVANEGDGNKYYLNNNTLSFTGAEISSDLQNSTSIALGDLNNDGFLDIAVANWKPSLFKSPRAMEMLSCMSS
ncbi:MAG TPA: hypothetical protein DD381_13975, partial [Lentisphaeria bacterium]|nr:hypothetical protein [Lentisphaeria bacterium]